MTASRTANYCRRVGVGALLVVLADFLFYGQPVGITVFLFGIVLAGAIVAMHPASLSLFSRTSPGKTRRAFPGKTATRLSWNCSGRIWLRPMALLAALLPLAENVSLLSIIVALAGLALFALSLAGRLRTGIARVAGQLCLFLAVAPFQFVRDLFRWRKVSRRAGGRRFRLTVAVWLMPISLGVVFLALFNAANPVIEQWLSRINLFVLLEQIDVLRLAFWLFVLAGTWPFLRPRLPRLLRRIMRATTPRAPRARPAAGATEDILFGKAAILRSLLVFNGLFAVQTALDAAYLWGGLALPDGLTYAAYAHRGAYPLMVTALLAAAFVLTALRPGSETSRDPLIRRLVYLWVAQNIVLVISSILRLDLYVGAYALTYLRVAAFIWMGLVALGLALVIVRIALEKSNAWLLSVNLLTLSATLYACCFVNFAALIANYNVDHSFEMNGPGTSLDIAYIRSLGPAGLPALDRLSQHKSEIFLSYSRDITDAEVETCYRAEQKNWRRWSFRDWRLLRYLDARGPLLIPQGCQPDSSPD